MKSHKPRVIKDGTLCKKYELEGYGDNLVFAKGVTKKNKHAETPEDLAMANKALTETLNLYKQC